MMPPKPKNNSVKPLRSRSELSPLQDDSTVDENGEGSIPDDVEKSEEPGHAVAEGSEDNEPSDEEVVESLIEGLSDEQKSLLLAKLQEESSANTDADKE